MDTEEKKKEDGGPAFPSAVWIGEVGKTEGGLTLLDHFAGQALQGDWAAQSEDLGWWTDTVSQENLDKRAKLYYRMGAAMLKARQS